MQIIIPYALNETIKALVANFSDEFTLFGKSHLEDGNVIIEDVRVPEQESGGALTEVTADRLITFTQELKASGENLIDWNVWIHSHNTMGAFWSPTDSGQMKDYAGGRDYFTSLVFSSEESRPVRGAITQYRPFEFENDNVTITILPKPELSLEDMPEEVAKAKKLMKKYFDLWKRQEKIVTAYRQERESIVSGSIQERIEVLKLEIETKNHKKSFNSTEYDDDTPVYDWFGLAIEKLTGERRKQADRLRVATKSHPSQCWCAQCEELWAAVYDWPKGKYNGTD